MFTEGQFYTRKQIHDKVGGSMQEYLPTVRKEVVCACLRKDLNPKAPDEILVGSLSRVKFSAEILCKQVNPIPVFIKIKTNKWQYNDLYKVEGFTEKPEEILKYVIKSDRQNVTRVIFLSRSHN